MRYLFLIILITLILKAKGQNNYDRLSQYFTTAKNFNGSVLVATGDKIDFLKGFGAGNRDSSIPVTAGSKFRIASITKTFTAVLILQLMEAGKLQLDDFVGKYLPAYTGEGGGKIKIEHLLTYSSGLRNCEDYIGAGIYQTPISIDSFIAKYCSGKLLARPGERFNYNNGDYVLLGRIIEHVTGKTFSKNLHEKILAPLSMSNTGMLASKDLITGLLPSYLHDTAAGFQPEQPYLIENFFAAGAMYSTVEDLYKFDKGLFNYKLLRRETVEQMIRPTPNLNNAGLGFWYADKYGKITERFVYRPGGIYGSSVNWIHCLESNRSIIVFSNTNATNLFEFSQELYDLSR